MEICVGDWIRFEKSGTIVLGIVNYIDKNPTSYPYSPQAITDIGRVDICRILECRKIISSENNK